MLPESVRRWAFPTGTPLVHRRDRHPDQGCHFADPHQRDHVAGHTGCLILCVLHVPQVCDDSPKRTDGRLYSYLSYSNVWGLCWTLHFQVPSRKPGNGV